MMDIQVIRKNVYGKERFYPVTEDSKFLTKLLGCPSLSMRHLKLCKLKGWSVAITTETIDLDDFLKENKE